MIMILTFFGYSTNEMTKFEVKNDNIYKNADIAYQLIPIETDIVYKRNMPTGVEKIVANGEVGVIAYNYEREEEVVISEMVKQVNYVGIGPKGNFQGSLTGYGPDCRGCNGRGYVGCRDKHGVYHNLISDGMFYNDDEYGEIRIVAGPSGAVYDGGPSFSCGTIVHIKSKKVDLVAIVLDRGSAMQSKLNNGKILLDLAFESEAEQLAEIRNITERGTVEFNVKRWGF